MAAMFPSSVCKILLVAFTVVVFLFTAGEATSPGWEAELIKDYYMCQSLGSRLVEPNCYVWCQHMGFIKGGSVTTGSCCCTE